MIILQLYIGKKEKIQLQANESCPLDPIGERCVDACFAVSFVQGPGYRGEEMKIRYVFILLIIIVLALFKKMAD